MYFDLGNLLVSDEVSKLELLNGVIDLVNTAQSQPKFLVLGVLWGGFRYEELNGVVSVYSKDSNVFTIDTNSKEGLQVTAPTGKRGELIHSFIGGIEQLEGFLLHTYSLYVDDQPPYLQGGLVRLEGNPISVNISIH
jgi:hypothetical protein